jgi:hypothetical protein
MGLPYGKTEIPVPRVERIEFYREFSQAMHQTCLAHLLRRCRELASRSSRMGFGCTTRERRSLTLASSQCLFQSTPQTFILGARTQSVLVSILQTCRQQLCPVSSFLQKLICSPQPEVLDLTSIFPQSRTRAEVATNCPTAD